MNLNNNNEINNDIKNINSLLKKLNKKVIVILGVNFDPCLEKINSKQDYNYKIRNECDRFLAKISYDFMEKIECETEFKFTNKNINLKIGQKIQIMPNHACVVTNMLDEVNLITEAKELKKVKVIGRGKVW